MKINVLMNSISDPHLNQRIARFKEDGHDVRLYGFDRCIDTKSREDVSVIGTFTNTMNYRKRIKIYLNSIRNLFKSGIDIVEYGNIKDWMLPCLPHSSTLIKDMFMKNVILFIQM